jgi:hypothetical protein
MKTINTGNNESISRGIVRENDGTFTALAFTASRNFKTERGAVGWLTARGIAVIAEAQAAGWPTVRISRKTSKSNAFCACIATSRP